jgi:hypothetical protein
MNIQRIAISVVFAAGLAALPLSTAEAQYIYPCNPFPLFWPFCAAAAAATIVTAPFRAIASAPYYGAPYYYPPPGAYYPPGTNGSPYAYYDGRR